MKKGNQSPTAHLIYNCDECGGRLVFDRELTTRRGESEWCSFLCTECGAENKRLMVLD
jgi:DNA-directed RNA polymerase subunit RPC12/RpoP